MKSKITPATTETLTDEMIRELREEAGAAGDTSMAALCRTALGGHQNCDSPLSPSTACSQIADSITSARAQDDLVFFVRVVP